MPALQTLVSSPPAPQIIKLTVYIAVYIACSCLHCSQIHRVEKGEHRRHDVLQVPAVLRFKVFIQVKSEFNVFLELTPKTQS